ncbi:hypothetical protein UFOVP1264_19 [uncultured Caudovirales phage]|uniref:Uncharacterized protein n=1 Tax=uncultured Caudovirales phage TaxID=2100421 RepID=A0A6J5RRT7_9CAUD|nr:hypothetical protein UFOVP1264_19 [uncultured Caudovirales phage]
MAFEEGLKSITLNADSSIGSYTGVPGLPGSADPNNGKQYCFVKVTGAKTAGLAVLATDNVIGVLQNKPQKTGAAATVGIFGVSFVVTGAGVSSTNIAAGDKVVSDTAGAAVKWTADSSYTTTPKVVCGVALAASSVAGELIPVLLG